ncbi:isocitrate lyase/phosphoenolpyruvate mutase family protein [Bradyrhizobium sp. LB14.3]|uniref:isocitrate lyase/phosphoenolpyruvate mutase family protein n=1 Tax=Bradyrhizobium sp. LB14.3 TaxID=3156328 RepID=UPI0033911DED
MAETGLVHIMVAHSPFSAIFAEEAGFDGLWASGFELSAPFGLQDMSLISMTQHLDMLRAIAGRTRLPIVAEIGRGFPRHRPHRSLDCQPRRSGGPASGARAEAGADMILIHSKRTNPSEIESFSRAWTGAVPLVIVPNAYPDLESKRVKTLGNVSMMIFGRAIAQSW